MKIGIDIGNVIIGGGGEDTSFFGDDFLKTPAVDGAKKSLTLLWMNEKVKEIHLVSKAGPSTEERSMRWLDWNNFSTAVIRPQRVHFVRKRHLKAPMAQALELDIFIDDRQDIIDSLEGIVKHRILFTSWEQTNKELEEIFQS